MFESVSNPRAVRWRVAFGAVVFALFGGACKEFVAPEETQVTVEFLGIPVDSTLTVTDTVRIRAQLISPRGIVTGATLSWVSSAPEILTVSESEDGSALLTALTQGDAEIEVIIGGRGLATPQPSPSIHVTVEPLRLSPMPGQWIGSTAVSERGELEVVVSDRAGNPVPDMELIWESSDPNVLEVTRDQAPDGADAREALAAGLKANYVAVGVGGSQVLVTAQRPSFESVTYSASVTVAGLDEVRSHASDPLAPGWGDSIRVGELDVVELRVGTAGLGGGLDLVDGLTVNWQSSDPEVLRVTAIPPDGNALGDTTGVYQALVRGRLPGTAQITARLNRLGVQEQLFLGSITVSPLSLTVPASWPATTNVNDVDTVAMTVTGIRGLAPDSITVGWVSSITDRAEVIDYSVEGVGNEREIVVGSDSITVYDQLVIRGEVASRARGAVSIKASIRPVGGVDPRAESDPEEHMLTALERWASVSSGGGHSCAIASDQHAYCWGWGFLGQLGPSFESSETPVQVVGGQRFRMVTVGSAHACGIDLGDFLWCWGDNSRGAIGDGTVQPRPVPVRIFGPPTRWKAVDAGRDTTCGIDEGNGGHFNAPEAVFCWGYAGYGAEAGLPPATTAAGHIGFIRALDDRFAQLTTCTARFGFLTPCQLLVGHYSFPPQWVADGRQFTTPGTARWPVMTSNEYQDVGIAASSLRNQGSVSVGGGHVCALSEASGEPRCWGLDHYGQVGLGILATVPALRVPASGSPVVSETVSLHGACVLDPDEGRELRLNTVPTNPRSEGPTVAADCVRRAARVDTNLTFVQISAGLGATYGTGHGGFVGYHRGGHTCAVTAAGEVHCWGGDTSGSSFGQTRTSPELIPRPNDVSAWTHVEAGAQHACALSVEGGVYCWGRGDWGQLGVVATESVAPQRVVGPDPAEPLVFKSVSVGAFQACGITDPDDALYCWGDPSGGLGSGADVPNWGGTPSRLADPPPTGG